MAGRHAAPAPVLTPDMRATLIERINGWGNADAPGYLEDLAAIPDGTPLRQYPDTPPAIWAVAEAASAERLVTDIPGDDNGREPLHFSSNPID